MIARLRSAETIGRPLGSRKFLDTLERKTRRILSPCQTRAEAAHGGLSVTVIPVEFTAVFHWCKSGWWSSAAFFKLEGELVNIGLGRGFSVEYL
jgi:hypothetical protein